MATRTPTAPAAAAQITPPSCVPSTLMPMDLPVPGTVIEYRVSDLPGGRCRASVDFHRIARGVRGRLVGAVVQVTGARSFSADLRQTLARLEAQTLVR